MLEACSYRQYGEITFSTTMEWLLILHLHLLCTVHRHWITMLTHAFNYLAAFVLAFVAVGSFAWFVFALFGTLRHLKVCLSRY